VYKEKQFPKDNVTLIILATAITSSVLTSVGVIVSVTFRLGEQYQQFQNRLEFGPIEKV